MPGVGEIYNLYLKSQHLKPDGVEVAITAAERKELHPVPGSDQVKPALVLSFKNATRKMVLNQTQASALVDIAGEDYSAWIGCVIRLVPVVLNKKQSTIRIERPTRANGK